MNNALISTLVSWSKGNPGAANFLAQVASADDPVQTLIIIEALEETPTIRGTNLYVLYSDLCGRDMEKVARLCRDCPSDILQDACSRQDYSGRQLVQPYL